MFCTHFDTSCPSCDEPVYEGDRVGFLDGSVCCEACVELDGEDVAS